MIISVLRSLLERVTTRRVRSVRACVPRLATTLVLLGAGATAAADQDLTGRRGWIQSDATFHDAPGGSATIVLDWGSTGFNANYMPWVIVEADGERLLHAPVNRTESSGPITLALSPSNPRTITLHAATSTRAVPLGKLKLDEIVVRATGTQGALEHVSFPCRLGPGGERCAPRLAYQTWEIPDGHALVLSAQGISDAPSGPVLTPERLVVASSSPDLLINDAGEIDVADYGSDWFLVGPHADRIYRLRMFPWSTDWRDGTELARARVRAFQPDEVICPVDRTPVGTVNADPERFVGLVGNELGLKPDGGGCQAIDHLDFVADELWALGVRTVRFTIKWHIVNRCPTLEQIAAGATGCVTSDPSPGAPEACWPPQQIPNTPQAEVRCPALGSEQTWCYYERLFEPFAQRGFDIWVTIGNTPCWATRAPFGDDRYFVWPPEQRWYDEFRSFVSACVHRFGPGTASDVRNWEIWQEPDTTRHFGDGTVGEYLALLDIGGRALRDPRNHQHPDGASAIRIWAPNLVAGTRRPEFRLTEFLDPLFDAYADAWEDDRHVLFDGLAAHTFFMEPELELYSQTVLFLRSIVASDPRVPADMPVAVNAASYFNGCSFAADVPDAAEQAEFVGGVLACVANAGAEHGFWFSSTAQMLDCDAPPDGVYETEDPSGILGRFRRPADPEECPPSPETFGEDRFRWHETGSREQYRAIERLIGSLRSRRDAP